MRCYQWNNGKIHRAGFRPKTTDCGKRIPIDSVEVPLADADHRHPRNKRKPKSCLKCFPL